MKIPENLWLQDIKKTEYIFLAVKSIAVILLITYVFYESFLPIFFMIPIWVIYARDGLRDLCRKKEKEFRVQFSNAIQAMGAALKAGYSVENAIREAEKDLAPMYEENVRIRKEFRKMVHQLDNAGSQRDGTVFRKNETRGYRRFCHCIFICEDERRRQYFNHTKCSKDYKRED